MLTDAEARKAKQAEKPFKLYDSGGLFLLVNKTGSKLWRMKYKIGGKEKMLSFGPYPEVTISAARDARDAARLELRSGRDPSLTRRVLRANATATDRNFEVLARAWHVQNKTRWKERHSADVIDSLEQGVFPRLGKVDVREITPAMVLDVLRRIEARPAVETARRVRQRMSAVFEYAIGSGLAEKDPSSVVRSALAPMTKGRQPALVTLEEVRQVLRDVEAEAAHPLTKLGVRLLALTAVRPGDLRGAVWGEFIGLEGVAPMWCIPAERMKMKRPHFVPLVPQAVEVIEAVRALSGRMMFVFPNARHSQKPMSENALGYLLNRAGYHNRHVPHGFRASFSTIMNERFRADRAVIDLMLAHAPRGQAAEPVSSSEAAYNRAQHMERRRDLAQLWADMLMEGMPAAGVMLEGRRR